VVEPDRALTPGVEVETDLGAFQVYETPGHAPSHICLHQPDRGVLISGDHLLGRVSLYYDYGHTPDPAGEFLNSLDVVGALDSSLCLAGHGRPFRDVKEHIEANRREVAERMGRVRAALSDGDGQPKTPFEIVPILLGDPNPSPMMVNWGLSETLSYLRHLEQLEQAQRVESEPAERWSLAA
jgi:glyoxylase-like metal-dependent hydrolase (beta-lactamase superfamily II)